MLLYIRMLWYHELSHKMDRSMVNKARHTDLKKMEADCILLHIRTLRDHGIPHKMDRRIKNKVRRSDLESLEADCSGSCNMMYIPHIQIHKALHCSILFHIGMLWDHGMTHKTGRSWKGKARRIDTV